MAGVKIPKCSQLKPQPDVSVWPPVMHFSLLNSIQPRQLPGLTEDPQGKKVMCTRMKKILCERSPPSWLGVPVSAVFIPWASLHEIRHPSSHGGRPALVFLIGCLFY